MRGIKNFVLGFSLSLFSMSLTGQLYSSVSTTRPPHLRPSSDIKVDLFKSNTGAGTLSANIFAKIEKEKVSPPAESTQQPYSFSVASSSTAADTPSVQAATSSDEETIYEPQDINGIEDDEILSINIDDNIPIEFAATSDNISETKILHGDIGDKVAILPTTINTPSEDFTTDSPWIVAKGSKHIKNKKLLEQYSEVDAPQLFTENIHSSTDNGEEISYKVAERIKQSIIFPIPDEILNDENLTPTFIKSNAKKSAQPSPHPQVNPTPKKARESKQTTPKILVKKDVAQATKKDDKGLLNSISSWFSEKDRPEAAPSPKPKAAPVYSSQNENPKAVQMNSNDDFVSFYETIQETSQEEARNKILPSELKLSFQPERAEISGQTLRWLKAFSEAAQESNTYLQIRLDATAPIELQRKRLNLLYTILINNGVDFKKIDTVFSLTEPNAFIIRTLKLSSTPQKKGF